MNFFFLKRETFLVFAACAIAACGNSSNETAGETAPSSQLGATASAVATVAEVPASVLAKATAGGHCALDEVNNIVLGDGTPSIKAKTAQSLTASGWVVNNSLQAPSKITLVLSAADGSTAYGMDGVTGVGRPDVAKALNADGAGSSGFNLAGNLGSTPAGTYKVMILSKGANGNEICDTTRQITVGA